MPVDYIINIIMVNYGDAAEQVGVIICIIYQ